MINVKFCNKITNFILIWLAVYGGDISAFTCYRCQGADCQKESKLSDTITCVPFDECVSVFQGFSIVQRGCYSQLPELHQKECDDPYGNNCHMCSEHLCNNLGPTKCIQCLEKENWFCLHHSDRIVATRCPLSSLGQINCYATQHNQSERALYGSVFRGCLRDANQEAQCQRNPNCIVCQPVPGFACNNKAAPPEMANKHASQADSSGNDGHSGIFWLCALWGGVIIQRIIEG